MRPAATASFDDAGRAAAPGVCASRGKRTRSFSEAPSRLAGRTVFDQVSSLDETRASQADRRSRLPEGRVLDARFIRRTPHVHGDLLAYATNRRNGVDFDVVARGLSTGDERTFELVGSIGIEAISLDGRWIAVERVGDRSGDNDLYLCDVASAGSCGARTRTLTT